jgi:hypothetical protein
MPFWMPGSTLLNLLLLLPFAHLSPADWRAQERRWDFYHWVRTFGLIAAFTILVPVRIVG